MFVLVQINFFLSCFMLGLIMTTQGVSYPMFLEVKKDFSLYHDSYVKKISKLVIPIMLTELGLAIVLVTKVPSLLSDALLIITISIFASSFLVQVPIHEKIKNKSDSILIKRLIKTNWIRVLLWSGKSVVSFKIMDNAYNNLLIS